jgi:hypothetical protein
MRRSRKPLSVVRRIEGSNPSPSAQPSGSRPGSRVGAGACGLSNRSAQSMKVRGGLRKSTGFTGHWRTTGAPSRRHTFSRKTTRGRGASKRPRFCAKNVWARLQCGRRRSRRRVTVRRARMHLARKTAGILLALFAWLIRVPRSSCCSPPSGSRSPPARHHVHLRRRGLGRHPDRPSRRGDADHRGNDAPRCGRVATP